MSTEGQAPVAIVTGASRGYGRAVTQQLLQAGWCVVGDGRDADALSASAQALGNPATFRAISGSIEDEAHLRELVEAATSLGPLRLVVNNAGGLGPSPLPKLADYPTDSLQALFHLNTVAPLRLIQLTLPVLLRNRGTVINITSDAAPEHYQGWGGYGATKSALEKLTGVLAVEEPEVRFYALDPGDMRTDMHQAAFPGEDISDRPEPEQSAPAVLKLVVGDLPSGRYRAADLLQ